MKQGHPSDRLACAKFAREQRARLPSLHGGWSRSDWNHQVSQAAANKLAILTQRRREAEREERRNIETQVAANRHDPLLMAMGWGN